MVNRFIPKSKLVALGGLPLVLLVGTAAQAATCADYTTDPLNLCIEHNNAVFVVQEAAGAQIMEVNNVSHIYLQDFFYDDLNDAPKGGAADIIGMENLYNASSAVVTNTGSALSLVYDSAKTARVQVDFILTGGDLNSDNATIQEVFTITNDTGAVMDLRMYAYTDIDLGFSATDDQGVLVGNAPYTQYMQFDADFEMLATTNIAPDHYQVGRGDPFYDVLTSLCAACSNVTLTDTVAAGPGDLEMAAQWDTLLADGASFSYTHTLTVSSATDVPLPAALPLAIAGLGLLGFAGRRKKLVKC